MKLENQLVTIISKTLKPPPGGHSLYTSLPKNRTFRLPCPGVSGRWLVLQQFIVFHNAFEDIYEPGLQHDTLTLTHKSY